MAHAVFSDTLRLGLFNLSTKAEGFLLPPGSGSQIPKFTHAFLLLCTLLISPLCYASRHSPPSPRMPEEGTWCLQATTDSQRREGLRDFLPISVTGSLPAVKCLHGVALAQSRASSPFAGTALPKILPVCGSSAHWHALHPLVGCCARAGAQFPVDSACGHGGESRACLSIRVQLRYSDASPAGVAQWLIIDL